MLVQGCGVKPVGIRSGLPDLMLLKSTPKHYYEAQMLKRRGLDYEMTCAQLDASIMWPAWKWQGDRACGGCSAQVSTPSRIVVRPDPDHYIFGVCAGCSVESDDEIVQRVRRRLQRGKAAPSIDDRDTWRRRQHEQQMSHEAKLQLVRSRAELSRYRAWLAAKEAEWPEEWLR
jgi:hypothetical protein